MLPIKREGSDDRYFGAVNDLQRWQGFVASELKLLFLSTNQDCEIDSGWSQWLKETGLRCYPQHS